MFTSILKKATTTAGVVSRYALRGVAAAAVGVMLLTGGFAADRAGELAERFERYVAADQRDDAKIREASGRLEAAVARWEAAKWTIAARRGLIRDRREDVRVAVRSTARSVGRIADWAPDLAREAYLRAGDALALPTAK